MGADPVTDIDPWPSGMGFRGREQWWYDLLERTEAERLDALLILAVMNQAVCRWLIDRDDRLFDQFQLSEETRLWLKTLEVSTLPEFAQALINKKSE